MCVFIHICSLSLTLTYVWSLRWFTVFLHRSLAYLHSLQDLIQARAHTHAHTQLKSKTGTGKQTQTHKRTHTHTHTNSHSLSLTHSLTHSRIHSLRLKPRNETDNHRYGHPYRQTPGGQPYPKNGHAGAGSAKSLLHLLRPAMRPAALHVCVIWPLCALRLATPHSCH